MGIGKVIMDVVKQVFTLGLLSIALCGYLRLVSILSLAQLFLQLLHLLL